MTKPRVRVKPGGWFAAGTFATITDDCGPAGVLAEGWRVCESQEAENKPVGTMYQDGELCPRDEFDWLDRLD